MREKRVSFCSSSPLSLGRRERGTKDVRSSWLENGESRVTTGTRNEKIQQHGYHRRRMPINPKSNNIKKPNVSLHWLITDSCYPMQLVSLGLSSGCNQSFRLLLTFWQSVPFGYTQYFHLVNSWIWFQWSLQRILLGSTWSWVLSDPLQTGQRVLWKAMDMGLRLG